MAAYLENVQLGATDGLKCSCAQKANQNIPPIHRKSGSLQKPPDVTQVIHLSSSHITQNVTRDNRRTDASALNSRLPEAAPVKIT